MTDPISGVSAKALSAIKPEQKKDDELRSADVEIPRCTSYSSDVR